jgi:hypothetical protein
MDLDKGELVENNSLISSSQELYHMTDPEWMVENLKDDLALQIALFSNHKIHDIDTGKLKKLAESLNFSVNLDTAKDLRVPVGQLLNKYAFAATKYILNKAKAFAEMNNKKLLVVIFDPYQVTKSLIENKPRYDQEIVDFLQESKFSYFDMNLVHVEDYRNFNLSIEDYFNRYFIGHYSPAGNHFFAFSIKPIVVEWLRPKPITYQSLQEQMINFKGYLEGF